MIDLYARLGIPREATPEEIKRAYRKAAATHHPDKGGKREDFEAIQQAYEVLTDPEQRKQYDETGEIGMPAWAKFLAALFNKALSEADERTDLVQWVRNEIKGGRRQSKEMQAQMRRDIAKLEEMRPRVHGPLLEKLIDGKIAQGKRSLAAMVADYELGAVMLEKIADYRHDRPEPSPVVAVTEDQFPDYFNHFGLRPEPKVRVDCS